MYNIRSYQENREKEEECKKINKYIEETALPRFSQEIIEDLENEISTEEIQQAIAGLVLGKSPGPDGYTARFYKKFQDLIIQILKKTYNSISNTQIFTPQSTEAHIILIPKPDKDHTMCKNYRPISLTNIDIRLYSKIISNRLTPILPNYIELDQTGFMKGRETKDNIIKTCTLIEYAQKTAIQTCLLTVDAEKAFDRVAGQFLKEALIQIGMDPKMFNRIVALYSNSRAKVRTNGILSEYIEITNGTRQGCPLSPLLYILVMEHLVMAIRKNKDIKGIKIKDNEYKTAVYADDLLIYVTNPILQFQI